MNADDAGARLNAALAEAGMEHLSSGLAGKFEQYLSLILRWNARLNLTSLRTEDAIISNHLRESIACAMAIPDGVHTLLDFGSGAGLPGIPIALCRPEISVTLAESQGKKAAFLREVVRTLEISAQVYAGRAETLGAVYDCVTMRAVDRMPRAVRAATALVAVDGWLALMTTNAGFAGLQFAAGQELSWPRQMPIPGSENRIVALGRRKPDLQTM
jgi:16S rRNA (guanine527-N7)-methyltransferase